eukprot:44795-Rhodomonas_salina.1
MGEYDRGSCSELMQEILGMKRRKGRCGREWEEMRVWTNNRSFGAGDERKRKREIGERGAVWR